MDSLSVDPPSFFMNLCSVPKLYNFPVGLDSPLIELKKRLIDNNTVVSLLVSAPPGCGKTTLVTHFCHDSQVKSKFKHILFNVVSSTPDFRRIVQNLLLHNGYATQTFENDTRATVALRNLLEELSEDGPVLLVLDDVWQGADSFLEKFRISIPDYKILVTSRSEFQSFDSTYYLKPLEGENARALLVQWASRPPGASPAEYEYLLQMILKRCNGFPLVIVVIGRLLKGRSLNTWKKLVESWYQGETILDFPPQPSVLQRLKSSFNALDPNLKECFLDMGSFLEDQKIRASVIIDMWVELYGFSSIILCKKYLEDLASHNLLKLVPLGNEHEDGFYYDYLVTQHGILRELAIRQSGLKSFVERKRLYLEIREDTFPDWCLNQREPIMINASILSISTDDSFSSNWVQMDCPNVEALILHYTSRNFALPSFIAGMKKLKVLIVTNHGPYRERLGNCSCLRLLPNLKRIRLSNQVWSAPDMPFDTSDLKQDSFPMNSQWKKGKLLGRGTYGSVYVATNTGTGALCAVKVVELYPDDLKSAECAKQLEQEIKLLSNLLHPNIVQYFGSETLEDRFFIYLEYVHPGSINKYIQDHCAGTMTESVVRNFTRHILSGLAYLHSKKTVHRDIKGANLLVDASGVVKLADFGVAKHLTGQRADLSSKGSPYWMAPELIQPEMQRDSNPHLAFAVDIWSLGCTIIEMFTGKHPWSGLEWIAAMYKVMTESPPVPELMSPEGKDFLSLCFQRNPAERPTASKLLKHQFLSTTLCKPT